MKTLGKMILLSLNITMIVSAGTQDNIGKHSTLPNNSSDKSHPTYQAMTTEELQATVEKNSKDGNLPFTLGQELIKRWTNI